MRGVLIVGSGPAGLMAAETLGQAGVGVTIVDANPKPGRKFLIAGRSGLNLTHSEPLPGFTRRYREHAERFAEYFKIFPPSAMRAWADGLGAETFVGSSGRVFPRMFKGANLLSAWLDRLKSLNVRCLGRHSLSQIAPGPHVTCTTPNGDRHFDPKAVILALGGVSWPETGSDGRWTSLLAQHGVPLSPWQPANVGLEVIWPESILALAGEPLKTVALRAPTGPWVPGELVITKTGVEGGGIYAVSRDLREALSANGPVDLHIDLKPGLSSEVLNERGANLSRDELVRRLRLSPVAAALLATYGGDQPLAAIKNLAIPITGTSPISEAISSAGGIPFSACDQGLQLNDLPGVWVCGEMLDWEAPTGGYLLQGCVSTGVWAAQAVLAHLGLPPAMPAVHSPMPQPGISR